RTHDDHLEETAMTCGQHAACKGQDPSLWATDSSPSQQAKGQAICQRCPVRTECLTAALEEDTIHVVRGGVTFSRELAARVRHLKEAGLGIHDLRDELSADTPSPVAA